MDRFGNPGERRFAARGLVVVALFAAAVGAAAETKMEARPLSRSTAVGGRIIVDLQFVEAEDPLESTGELPPTTSDGARPAASFDDAIGFELPPLPDTLLHEDGPFQVETGEDEDDAPPVYRVVFSAIAPGRRVLGSFLAQIGDFTFRSEPIVIEVSERPGARVVPDLLWSPPSDTLFRGQSAHVPLEIRNALALSLPEDVRVETAEGAIMEEVSGVGSVRRTNAVGGPLHDFAVVEYIVTPTTVGELVLPSAAVTVDGVRLVAPAMPITVVPPPPEIESSGAIGRFRVSADISATEVRFGEEITVYQRIDGEGNFGFLDLLPPVVVGARETLRDESEVLQPSAAGRTGYREVRTRFVADIADADAVRVTIPEIAWYDPVNRRVDRAGPWTLTAAVVGGAVAVRDGEVDTALRLLDDARCRALRPLNAYRSPWTYLLFLPGPLVFLIASFVRRGRRTGVTATTMSIALLVVLIVVGCRREEIPTPTADVVETLAAGDTEGAIGIARDLVLRNPANPGYQHNLGRLELLFGSGARAVFHLREAVRLQPSAPELRESLSEAQRLLGLSRQITEPQPTHPDRVLAILVVLFNGAFILGTLLGNRLAQRRSAGWLVIALVLTGAGVPVSGAGFVATLRARAAEIGTVADGGAPLRNVPSAESGSRSVLDPGTAVYVVAAHQQYQLVRTTFGITGWIDVQELVRPPALPEDDSADTPPDLPAPSETIDDASPLAEP